MERFQSHVFGPNHAVCLQALQAGKELQRNLAADNAGFVYVWKVWCSSVTPHQMVCGDLAAWCAQPAASTCMLREFDAPEYFEQKHEIMHCGDELPHSCLLNGACSPRASLLTGLTVYTPAAFLLTWVRAPACC